MSLVNFASLGADCALNALWAYWVANKKLVRASIFLQVAVDLGLIFLGIYLPGGIENSWGFLPAILIIMVGFCFSFQASFLAALISFLLFVAMVGGEILGIIPHFSPHGFEEHIWKNPAYALDYMAGMAFLYFTSALISGYFGEQIRKTKSWLEKEVARLNKKLETKLEETNAELYRRNKELKESEAKAQAQYRSFPIPTYTWKQSGADFQLIDYNDAASAITGGKIAGYLDKKASEMYKNQPEISKDFVTCFERKKSFRREMLYHFKSTGEEKYLDVNYAFVPPDLLMVYTEDVSERRQVEERYKNIIGTALDGFWIIEAQGRFLEVNRAYAQMIGYSREELLKMSIPEIEAGEQAAETAARIKKTLKSGSSRFTSKHRRKDGRVIDVEISANRILASDGLISVFIRDITQNKQAEEELKKYVEELEKTNKFMEGRELDMIELKKEINQLLKESGRTEKYKT